MSRESHDHSRERRLRRQALQVAELLPEDETEALLVVGYTKELIESFLMKRQSGSVISTVEGRALRSVPSE